MKPSASADTRTTSTPRNGRLGRTLVLAGVLAATLSACVPLVVGTAVGGAWLALDRRTSGAQLEDEGIEARGSNRIQEVLKDRGRVSVTSYNRVMLLTGQVTTDADRQLAENTARTVPNVRRVVNDILINPSATLSQRSTDALTSTRVKGALVGSNQINSNAVKVTTELGTVYLMGIVTQREADAAAEAARNVGGVLKVVKVFEIVPESALSSTTTVPAPVQSTAPATGTSTTTP